MTVRCEVCLNECCSCNGCNPTFVAGKWLCPTCAQRQSQPQQKTVYNITVNGNNQQQVITNYMRKR